MTAPKASRTPRRLARGAAVLLLALAGAAQAAPPFRLQTPSGTAVEFTGKSAAPATLVFFWASWCPYCKALMPHLQSVLDQYGDAVRLYAIDINDDGDPAAWLAANGYDWTLLLNGEEAAQAWGVRGTPGLFVVDRGGAIVFDLSRLQASAAVQARLAGAEGHPQLASRKAPYWAAELRRALEPVVRAAR